MGASLANSKTPAILRAEIILKSSGFLGIFLAVEGDFDSRFWCTRIDVNNARIVHCGGKTNLLGLLDLYKQNNYMRLAAIADADFDRLLGNSRSLWCLSYTDLCDLESTLIYSNAFQRVIAEYGDIAKIQHFENINNLDVKEHLRVTSTYFGKLRFINFVNNYSVDFDKLSPYKYVDKVSWCLDEVRLVQDFLGLAKITQITLMENQGALLRNFVFDDWSFVQGHDCMKILAIGLGHSVIGKSGQRSVDKEELQRAFCLTFDSSNLKESKMYQSLLKAQQLHKLPLFISID